MSAREQGAEGQELATVVERLRMFVGRMLVLEGRVLVVLGEVQAQCVMCSWCS